MSRYSVAKTCLITLGVWGRLFGAPTVFLSLAKSVSFFLQKERNGGNPFSNKKPGRPKPSGL
jgi:hypothetical protein